MQVVCNLGSSQAPDGWLRRSEVFGTAIKFILDAMVANNLLYLSLHPNTPPLYRSGVRYANEPEWKFNGKPAEEFASIPIVLERLKGDCDDLATYRCAELIRRGERATIRIQWRRRVYSDGTKGRKYFHVVVRRQNGSIEDPSALLGMHDVVRVPA